MNVCLIIGTVWAERHASAAGVRMWRLIEMLQKSGREVVFGSGAANETARQELEDAGIRTVDTPVNDPAFDELIRGLKPEVVIFDRFMTEEQFSWRVREQCPDALRVLDTIDLHFLRYARQKNVDQPDLGPGNETLLRELAAIYRSDLSLIISNHEFELLVNQLRIPVDKLCYHPLVYPPAEDAPGFDARNDFCTVGNFMHAPNMDAVDRLAKVLWPAIWNQLPEANMFVYGAYVSERARQLHKPAEGFHIVGNADDLGAVLRKHRVLLAPLRFGAGLKGKVMDAWYYGQAVVTTPIGAEGLFPDEAWGGAIAHSDPCFVSEAVRLYGDAASWAAAVAEGREILATQFDETTHQQGLLEAFQAVQRSGDVLGALLWREQTRSTEFMSRWIELKNEK